MDSYSEENPESQSRYDENQSQSYIYDGQLDISQLPRTEGYLYKKGGAIKGRGGRRNWKKRWFVLHPIEFRGKIAYELQYYDSPNGKLKGAVGLFDVEVYCEVKSSHRRVKYEFQILLQNGSIFQLSCDSSEEREEWIESLNMTISYLRKVLLSSGYSLNGYDPIFEDEEECYQIGEEIAYNCKAFGPGLVGAEAGHKTHFLVQLYDVNNEIVQEGGMPIVATISNDEVLYYIRMVDNEDGTYSGYYAIGRPGLYDLHIKLNDEHNISSSPFQIEIFASKTVAEFCTAEGDSLFEVTPRSIAYFTIYGTDSFGNRKLKGGDPFEVSIVGPAQLKSLLDNSDGTYTCGFEVKSPNDMSYFTSSSLLISVTLYGKHIAGSPFHPSIADDYLTTNEIELSPPPPPPPLPLLSQPLSIDTKSRQEMNSEFKSSNNSIQTSSVSNAADQKRPKPVPRLSAKQRGQILTKEIEKIEATTGAPLSRLERARQRALMAKKLSESGIRGDIEPEQASAILNPSVTNQFPTSPNSTRGNRRASVARTDIDPITGLPYNIRQQSSNATSATNRLADDAIDVSKTELKANGGEWNLTDAEINKLLDPSLATKPEDPNSTRKKIQTRRASVQRTDIDPITGLPITAGKRKGQNPTTSTTNPSSSTIDGGKEAVLSSLRAQSISGNDATGSSGRQSMGGFSRQDIESIVNILGDGMVGSTPPSAGEDERLMWDLAHRALISSEVLNMLVVDLWPLKQTFNLLAIIVEGIQVLKLTNSNSGGAYRLLEEFDVVPTYLSMKEVKSAFSLILSVQRNTKSPSSMAGGGTGVDFPHFIKFLVMVSVYALSKTTAFASLYKTPASKIDVMLHKWGLADKVRLQLVQGSILQTS